MLSFSSPSDFNVSVSSLFTETKSETALLIETAADADSLPAKPVDIIRGTIQTDGHLKHVAQLLQYVVERGHDLGYANLSSS
jgi:hypothetical protein